jgi:hypothetical protein
MDPQLSADEYRELFELRAEGKEVQETFYQSLPRVDRLVDEYADKHRFFHWPLEFPDVFGPKTRGGFSATVGNPPWDIVKPNSQEFFSAYDKDFRSYNKQEAKRASQALMDANPNIAAGWESYTRIIQQQSEYFRDPNSYQALGKGDINTYKLFLEQFFRILQGKGRMGIVVPSGIYTDQGCQPLRELFFDKSGIEFLYGFENRWPTVFNNVDGRFKFVLFGTQKGKKTDEFKCAFMEHEPRRLASIDENALEMSVEQVRKFSPDTLSVMEFKSQKDIDLNNKLYSNAKKFGYYIKNELKSDFKREFHMTDDSNLYENYDENDTELVPLLEGKQFWILSNKILSPTRFMRKKFLSRKPTCLKNRIAYRAISASTNERTMIPTVIPKDIPSGHTVNICPLEVSDAIITSSVLSTFIFDWMLRNRVTTSISIFLLYQIPIKDIFFEQKKSIKISLLARASRLICTENEYTDIWNEIFNNSWTDTEFWYPNDIPIDNYGPAHEIEIRKKIRDEAATLTPEWGPHCGVYDKLTDRRDTGDRSQLRAEIDAYVAHLYGLSRDDFSYVLDTFPVLKNKEMKTFGEFMSKRKCLEEYDRINLIL